MIGLKIGVKRKIGLTPTSSFFLYINKKEVISMEISDKNQVTIEVIYYLYSDEEIYFD